MIIKKWTPITWPTMGLSHAEQQPFCVVVTPCLDMFSVREPSIQSRAASRFLPLDDGFA